MRYNLRTLLIALAIAPPMLAGLWINPRLALALLSFGPFLIFLFWQLRLRNTARG